MAEKVGALIKEARTAAGLSEAELAEKVGGISKADIIAAERGEKKLTRQQLKAVAKATGVTQKSLLDAAKEPAKKGPAPATQEAAPPVTEEELLSLFRAADADTQKAAIAALKGEKPNPMAMFASMMGGGGENGENPMAAMMGGGGENGENPMAAMMSMFGGMMGGGQNKKKDEE